MTSESESISPLPETNGDSQRPQASGPTWEERRALVRALQVRALDRADPLAANLEVISGDLLLVMHRAWQKLEAKLLDGAMSEGRFDREIENYRKLAREVTRSAQAVRLLLHPTRGGVTED